MHTEMISGGTYRFNLQVFALEGFEQIGNSSFQSSIDEDSITEVVQKNGPQSIYITCRNTRKTWISIHYISLQNSLTTITGV